MNSNEKLFPFFLLLFSLLLFFHGYSQAVSRVSVDSTPPQNHTDSFPISNESSYPSTEFAPAKNEKSTLNDYYLSRYEYFVTQNRRSDSAHYYLLKAYVLGLPEAYYFLGLSYLKGVNGFSFRPKRGLELLHTLADTGHAYAALRLMELYGDTSKSPFLHPFFIKIRDPKKAIQYAEIAAKKGKPEAYRYLAWAYHTGYGTKRNDTLAIYYLRQLAEKWNWSWAQTTLGIWYYRGLTSFGVQFDLAKKYFQMVLQNKYAQPEEIAEAESSLHEIKHFPQLIINTIFRLFYFFPAGYLIQDFRW